MKKKRKTSRPARRPSSKASTRRPRAKKGRRLTAKRSGRPAASAATRNATPVSSVSSRVPSHMPTQGLFGWITHTDIASVDPIATREWCIKVLGWTFRPPFAMPNGDYHLFAYSQQGGGGVHPVNPGQQPTSIPYVHVADAFDAFDRAIRAGAQQILAPSRVSEGVTIAVVRAPGGVTIGLSGP